MFSTDTSSPETVGLLLERRSKPRPDGGRLRLLLIEDSAFDAGMIVRLLGQAGFIVEARRVEDESGLQTALREETWNAVISDHNLPDFSSTEALLIYQRSGMDAPFIIVSGRIGEDVAVEAMLAGADDYVLKSNLGRLPPALRRGLRAAESRSIRREAEQALAASEARLRGIATNLPGMMFQIEYQMSGRGWRFRYASEGAKGLFGVEPEVLLADTSQFLARIDLVDRMRLEVELAQDLRTQGGIRWDGRISGQNPLWIAIAGKSRGLGSDLILWEGVMIDITAQKMAEQALEQSRKGLRELTMHLEAIREEERKSIAREIHDDIGSLLTGLKFELSAFRSNASVNAAGVEYLDAMADMVESAREASDRIMRNLRPSILDQGIVAALEWLTREFTATYGIQTSFHANKESIALPEERRNAMFRICQEALTNVAKHAHASEVRVELFADPRSVSVEISDNGTGLLPADLEQIERFGIRGMRERAAGLNGWLELHGAPGTGTTVMLSLPPAEETGK